MYRKLVFILVFCKLFISNSNAVKEDTVEKSKETNDNIVTFKQPPVISSNGNAHHNKASQKGHILFFHNAGTRSHLIAMNALAEGLVENGHRVTTVFYAKSNLVHENYKEILIEDR